jgi:hypothetical protein
VSALPEIEREVSCPVCWAKCGQPCVGEYYGQGLDFNTPHGDVQAPHRERVERHEGFADLSRWPCRKPGCDGSRKAIAVGLYGEPSSPLHMLSSTEGGCSDCDWWIDDPASCITSDEMLRDMAPDLVETHELVPNPAAPTKREVGMEERQPMLVGEPKHKDAQFHLVPRTKSPEWNPLRRARLDVGGAA